VLVDLLAQFRAVDAAIDQIDAIHRDLVADRNRAADRVGHLLAGGWTGPAASTFGEAWETWTGDADDVLGALARLRELMVQTMLDLRRTDDEAAGDTSRLSSRLGQV
jgi:WXG100 family type VII secretion target